MSPRAPRPAEVKLAAFLEARQFVHGAMRDWRSLYSVGAKDIHHPIGRECPLDPTRRKQDVVWRGLEFVPELAMNPALGQGSMRWYHNAPGVWTFSASQEALQWSPPGWPVAPYASLSQEQLLRKSVAQIRMFSVVPVEEDYEEVEPTNPLGDRFEGERDGSAAFDSPSFRLVNLNSQDDVSPNFSNVGSRQPPAWLRPVARYLCYANRAECDSPLFGHAEYSDFESAPKFWLLTPWALAPFPSLEDAQAAFTAIAQDVYDLTRAKSFTRPQGAPLTVLSEHLPAVRPTLAGLLGCPTCVVSVRANLAAYQAHWLALRGLWLKLKVLSNAAHLRRRLPVYRPTVAPFIQDSRSRWRPWTDDEVE